MHSVLIVFFRGAYSRASKHQPCICLNKLQNIGRYNNELYSYTQQKEGKWLSLRSFLVEMSSACVTDYKTCSCSFKINFSFYSCFSINTITKFFHLPKTESTRRVLNNDIGDFLNKKLRNVK